MNLPFINSQTYRQKDYTASILPKGEYDSCKFVSCNFENSDISNNVFLECEFIDCNFSNANVMHTQFKDIEFKQCKLVGVQFNNSNDFLRNFNFTDCIMDFSAFTDIKIDGTFLFYANLLVQISQMLKQKKSYSRIVIRKTQSFRIQT